MYNGETTIANILSDKLFATPSDVKYSSYFQNRVQFDSNSCGAWLIAGLTCYLLGIPGSVASLTRKNVFNVVYLLLNENGSLDDKFKMISDYINDITYDGIFDKTNSTTTTTPPPTTTTKNKGENKSSIYTSAKFVIDELEKGKSSSYYKGTLNKGCAVNIFLSM